MWRPPSRRRAEYGNIPNAWPDRSDHLHPDSGRIAGEPFLRWYLSVPIAADEPDWIIRSMRDKSHSSEA